MTLDEFYHSNLSLNLRETNQWDEFGYRQCFQITYVVGLLGDAYGFNENSTQIVFANKLNKYSLGWSTGSLLRDTNWLPWQLERDSKKSNSNRYKKRMNIYLYFLIAMSVIAIGLCGVIAFQYCQKLSEATQTGGTRGPIRNSNRHMGKQNGDCQNFID